MLLIPLTFQGCYLHVISSRFDMEGVGKQGG